MSDPTLDPIIDAMPALAWSARPDGAADFFNRPYLDFIGYTAAQAREYGWLAAVHPDDVHALAETWRKILASAAPGEAEARLRRHDGVYRWFLCRANPLRDERGAIVKWYGINTDIDDRKRVEQALRRSEASLEEAQAASRRDAEALARAGAELARVARVTSLSALTASIAHEVNQPLAGVITNAGVLLRLLDSTPPDLEGARATARRTMRDGRRAAEVIARLRALFSRRAFTFDPLDLADATREVLTLSAADLQRHHIQLRTELAPNLPSVTGDRIQLQQVILNLLRNAVDAMAEVHDRPRHVLVRTEREEPGQVRVTVRDCGVGLPEPRASLFDAFHTTKSGGMGIGLFVSRSIVERHQGRLWAEPNDDGPGATFAFSIPLEPAR